MQVKALRVGGSGWVAKYGGDGWPWDDWRLARNGFHEGSLNLVLELGCYFHVPNTSVTGERTGTKNGVVYCATPVLVRCIKESVEDKSWRDGFIVRKRDEPPWLYHMVEVIAPRIEGLSKDLKEPFEIDGPFRKIGS